MRISDWSSDVCSSDLHADAVIAQQLAIRYRCPAARVVIDRFDLRRAGAHTLFLDRQTGLRVVTVADSRGRRPWAPLQGHGLPNTTDTEDRKSTRLNSSH